MRILFIQPTADKRGHYGIYTTNLCQELSRLGNEIYLFTNKVYPERFLDSQPLFKIIEYQNGKYAFEKFDKIKNQNSICYYWGYLKTCFLVLRGALKFLKNNRFEAVQIFDVEYGILSTLLWFYKKNLPPVALMINAPNFAFSRYPGFFLKRLYKVFQKVLLKARLGKEIKAIVTLGDFHKEELRKQFNLNSSFPIVTIRDGSKPPSYSLTKNQARQKLGINYQGPIFLFFGMLRKDKGLEFFLKAISLLKNEEFEVLIAGSLFDYKETEITSLIKSLGINDKIILKFGYIDEKEVYDYFFSGDVLVLPYIKLYTGGSGPLLKEAAICKMPAIVSNVSEMGRLVDKYQMGLVAEPENPESLAQKMKEFLSMSKEQKRKLGENAFRVANTWEKMAVEYLEFFKEALVQNESKKRLSYNENWLF